MTNDAVIEVIVEKAARMGFSKLIVLSMFYFAEHKKRAGAFFQPTKGFMSRFVSLEIDPVLPFCDVIKRVLPAWHKIGSPTNKDSFKGFQGAPWDLLGVSKNTVRALTKQVVIGDEWDGTESELGTSDNKEGSSYGLIKRRLDGAAYPKLILGSSVTTDGVSNIQKAANKAESNFRFHIPCPHCFGEQTLSWGGPKEDKGIKWDDEKETNAAKARTTYYCCEHCGGSIKYSQLAILSEQGRWIDEFDNWSSDGEAFYDVDGNSIAAPKRIAIREYSQLYSLNLSTGWSGLVEEWLSIETVEDRKTFINTVLAQYWIEEHKEEFEWQLLYNRREVYQAKVPMRCVYITAGVDTQDDRIEIYVWGWGANEESWLIDHDIVGGTMGLTDDKSNTSNLATREPWLKALEILNRTYEHELGFEMRINRICWDTGGHLGSHVHAFSKRHGLQRILPIRGAPTPGKPIALFPKKKCKHGTYFFEVGTEEAKENIYNRYKLATSDHRTPSPGYVHLPHDEAICSEDVVKQLCSEVKVPTRYKGRLTSKWDNKGKRNEAIDCYVYALAALKVSKSRFKVNLSQLTDDLIATYQIDTNTWTVPKSEINTALSVQPSNRKSKKKQKPKVTGGI
jgi:phage terminase large subunit GpA-like protein